MSLISIIKSLFGLSPKTANLSAGDRMLECADCEKQFVFDAGEQQFFKAKGFTDPKRCPTCRKKVRFRMKRKGGRGGSFGRRRDHGRRHHQNSVIDGDSPYLDER